MKHIKLIKFQKIILFIPFVNILAFFIWGYNMIILKKYIPFKKYMTIGFLSVLCMLLSNMLIEIVFNAMCNMISNEQVITILFYVQVYLFCLVLGIVGICSEKRMEAIIESMQQ